MKYSEILQVALSSVRANALRSMLTLAIIAVGITALVGILAAMDSMLYSFNENFNDLGTNSFTISRKFEDISSNKGGRRNKVGEPIDYEQAANFKDRFDFPAKVTISVQATGNATIQRGDKKTNPTVKVTGIDENHIDVQGLTLEVGRNFSDVEIQTGAMRAIIGEGIIKLLFDAKAEKAINEDILIGNVRYTIVGVLKEKGSAGGAQGGDRTVLVPLLNAKRIFDLKGQDFGINVGVQNALDLEPASQTASGLFRQVRRLRIEQADDFEIFKSDSLLNILKENTVKIRWATIAIALITLLGASIGLMNIMLVSVTERTREIGIRKALGATSKSILMQFLAEAMVICQMGGFVGIFLGVLMGLGVSVAFKSTFIVPWLWIFMGIVTCIVVGLFAGLYPAMKAAKLDPIESLRYE